MLVTYLLEEVKNQIEPFQNPLHSVCNGLNTGVKNLAHSSETNKIFEAAHFKANKHFYERLSKVHCQNSCASGRLIASIN